MKNILFSALFVVTALAQSFAAQQPAPCSTPAPEALMKKVTLYAGSVILLETNEKISTATATVGKTILFKVKMDVKAEGEVAIATGALAMGRVKYFSPSTHNNPAEARIELLYVQAVDGQQVPLNGNEMTVYGDTKGRGNDATFEFGSTITANVTNNIDIKAN